MNFRISGLEPSLFSRFFSMSDAELAAHRALRTISNSRPGFPCRVSLDDLAPGEEAILINFEHLPVESPYRSSHAIYVGANSREAFNRVGEIPPALASRLLSVRAFSAEGLMLEGDVLEGRELAPAIERLFEDPRIDFIHAHYARRGCFAARIDRS